MAKDTLVLKNGEVIELEECSSLSNMKVLSADKAAMVSVWEKLTPEELALVQVKNAEGLTIGNYSNLRLVSETSTINADESVLTSFSLRQKSAEELRLEALEEGQEIQNGAIEELAAMAAGGEA